jgi:hypothetical protein
VAQADDQDDNNPVVRQLGMLKDALARGLR